MTVLLIVVAVLVIFALIFAVALCKTAARADRAIERFARDRRNTQKW